MNAAEQDPRFAEGCSPETAAALQEERRKRWASMDVKRMIDACAFDLVVRGDPDKCLIRLRRNGMFAVDPTRFTDLMEAEPGTEGFKVVDVKRGTSEEQVAAAVRRRRLRPVTLTELLVYGAKLERKFRNHSEIVFGWPLGVVAGKFGSRYEITPLLHCCGELRQLHFSARRVGERWGLAGHRLGISKAR